MGSKATHQLRGPKNALHPVTQPVQPQTDRTPPLPKASKPTGKPSSENVPPPARRRKSR